MDGRFEGIESKRAIGWAWDPANPNSRVAVEVWLDGRVVASGRADLHRDDLEREGLGDGAHVFVIDVGDTVSPTTDGVLVITAGAQRVALRPVGGPEIVADGADPAAVRLRLSDSLTLRSSEAPHLGSVVGEIERVDQRTIEGWARRRGDPAEEVELELWCGDSLEARAVAVPRDEPDVGDRRETHRFAFDLPQIDAPTPGGPIAVLPADDARPLPLAENAHLFGSVSLGDRAPIGACFRIARADRAVAVVCPDGWLLPAWEAQALIGQPNGEHGETWRIARLARQLEVWHHDLAAFGCRFLAVLEPTKASIVDHLLEGGLGWPHHLSDELVARALDLDVELLDLRGGMRAACRHGGVIDRAGSRINARGTFHAGRAIAKAAGATALTAPDAASLPIDSWEAGDLATLDKVSRDGTPYAGAVDERWLEPLPVPSAAHSEQATSHRWLALASVHRRPALESELSRWFSVVAMEGAVPNLEAAELSGATILVYVLREIDLVASARAYADPGAGCASN